MNSVDVTFCVTSKSGLGHLARVHHIARAMRNSGSFGKLSLLSNALLPPGIFQCHHENTDLFDEVRITEESHFTNAFTKLKSHVAVIDTAVVPDVGRLSVPIVLVMRETRNEKLSLFAPTPKQGWDLVIVPNPATHWTPHSKFLPAHFIQHVGWIYDDFAITPGFYRRRELRKILLCTRGEGNLAWSAWEPQLRQLMSDVSKQLRCPLHITQLLGPRAQAGARFDWSDETFDSITSLDSHMENYDLIVTATGYNTVLELARCTSPALLIPLERAFDDQYARAEYWAPSLGYLFDPKDIPSATTWCADLLNNRKRRSTVQLGASGAAKAAALIRQVAQNSVATIC